MQLEISTLGDRLVKIALAGRLDTQSVARVEAEFVSAIVPQGNDAIVDLSAVDYMTSMGIRMLVSTARSLKLRERKLALYGVNPLVGEVFEAVALQKIIPICVTESEALAAVQSA